ncbi:MAG: hypothetical protein Q4F02_01765 [Candidatus Saccharibacteria bacterium]|nr:hypothetical protein [Candidatus Saccharibacteria bacterium]
MHEIPSSERCASCPVREKCRAILAVHAVETVIKYASGFNSEEEEVGRARKALGALGYDEEGRTTRDSLIDRLGDALRGCQGPVERHIPRRVVSLHRKSLMPKTGEGDEVRRRGLGGAARGEVVIRGRNIQDGATIADYDKPRGAANLKEVGDYYRVINAHTILEPLFNSSQQQTPPENQNDWRVMGYIMDICRQASQNSKKN